MNTPSTISFLIALLGFFSFASARPSATKRWWTNEIDLGYSVIRGFNADGLQQYKGIRYASAERFQAPHVPDTNRTLYTALNNGPICYQSSLNLTGISGPFNPAGQSEDCLFLDVLAPEGTSPGSNLPVVVYIHGGGYAFGSVAGQDFHQFVAVAASVNAPIVLVEIQYRLGAAGFISSNEVYNYGILNAGLIDQQYALTWVQEHIGKFGGDNSHVTIWGESAGAGSVESQVIANGGNTQKVLGLAKPLFSAAIANSVFNPSMYAYNDSRATIYYDAMVNATGCFGNSSTFKCMASVNEVAFANASFLVSRQAYYAHYVWVPVVDGTFLADRYSVLIQGGKYNVDNVLSWNNWNEAVAWADARLKVGANQTTEELNAAFSNVIRGFLPGVDETTVTAIVKQFPASDFTAVNNTYERNILLPGDGLLNCPGLAFAQYAKKGWYGEYVTANATHAADTTAYAQNFTTTHSNSSSASFLGVYMSFITTYDPNNNPFGNVNPYFPTIDQGQVLRVNTTDNTLLGQAYTTLEPINTPIAPDFQQGRVDQCNFWNSKAINAAWPN